MEEMQNRVQQAVTYIANLDLEKLAVGKYIVDDDFYYMVQEYETKPAAECKLESHQQYIDIQWIVEGCEVIEIANRASLSVKESYDENADVEFWELPSYMMRTVLQEGSYVILYPENAHMPCMMCDAPAKVKKIVGKVKIAP